MTSASAPAPAPQAPAVHPAVPAIPMTTLVQVELRKMVDTRAGRWLLGIVALITLAVLVIVVFASRGGDGSSEAMTYGDLLALSQLPATFLLPVIGILAATAEFSQRTALTTFSLVPSRSRVIAGKCAAGVCLAAGSILVSLVATALALVLAGIVGDYPTSWSGTSNGDI